MQSLFAIMVACALGGLIVGAFVRPPWRQRLLIALLAAPLVSYTVWLVVVSSAEPGIWEWWLVGLIRLAVPFLLAAAGTVILYFVGKAFARVLAARKDSA